METTHLTLRYDDFSRGDVGERDLYHAQPGEFSALNMTHRRDGTLQVRPELLAVDAEVGSGTLAAGTLLGFGSNQVQQADSWFIQDDKVYGFARVLNNTQNQPFLIGTLDTTPVTNVAFVQIGTLTYLTVAGDGTYVIEMSFTGTLGFNAQGSGTLTKLVDAPGGRCIAIYGDRLYVGGGPDTPLRVWYSGAADFALWDVLDPDNPAGYFDVGYQGEVTFLLPQKNHVAIGTKWGLWILTGIPADDTGVLRVVLTGVGAQDPTDAIIDTEDIIYLFPTGNALFQEWPMHFNGAVFQTFEDLVLAPYSETIATDTDRTPPENYTASTSLPGEVLLGNGVSGEAWFSKRRGIYTRVQWGSGSDDVLPALSGEFHRDIFLSDGGIDDTIPHFYRWFPDTLIPGVQDPGSLDIISAYLYLPLHWVPEGFEIRPRRVVVDFAEWALDDQASDNVPSHFDLTVLNYARFGSSNEGPMSSSTYEYTNAALINEVNQSNRFVAALGEQGWGAACQVKLDAIRAINIRSITVECDQRATAPRPSAMRSA